MTTVTETATEMMATGDDPRAKIAATTIRATLDTRKSAGNTPRKVAASTGLQMSEAPNAMLAASASAAMKSDSVTERGLKVDWNSSSGRLPSTTAETLAVRPTAPIAADRVSSTLGEPVVVALASSAARGRWECRQRWRQG